MLMVFFNLRNKDVLRLIPNSKSSLKALYKIESGGFSANLKLSRYFDFLLHFDLTPTYVWNTACSVLSGCLWKKSTCDSGGIRTHDLMLMSVDVLTSRLLSLTMTIGRLESYTCIAPGLAIVTKKTIPTSVLIMFSWFWFCNHWIWLHFSYGQCVMAMFCMVMNFRFGFDQCVWSMQISCASLKLIFRCEFTSS